MLILEGLVSLHITVQLQLLWLSGWGVDLDYYEWFALEMNRDHSFIFEIVPKHCISDSFVDCEDYALSSKDSVHSSRYKGHLN